jgi:multiple sugar transport system substrate-binding protein
MHKSKPLTLFLVIALLMTSVVFTVGAQEDDVVTFWSTEFQPARIERQQAIIDRFTEETGIQVIPAFMDENQMDQLMTINVASGTAPDVALHPLQLTAKWVNDGLLDPAFATELINNLGEDTFNPGALALLETGDSQYGAVPSDGWGQLLLYRRDLFEEAGLEPPTSYEDILAAAEALHDPENGVVGFMGPNSPSELYTWQVFEHIALANGATFVDAEGNVTFNTPEMVEAIQFYVDLMNNYGPDESDIYWLQTRATYFDGGAAMTIWSPFILDEMAGLRDSNLPTCPQCEENIAYLAENTGFVLGISGYSSDVPASWASLNNLGVSPDASPAARQFVEFWMNEAYLDGLSIAPEGKFPMRTGTPDEPNLYLEGWGNLDVGVDRRAPLSDFYDDETLNTIVSGAQTFSRMGYDVGQATLASAIGADFFIQENLVAALNGDLTAEEAAEEIQIAIEDLQFELGEE